MVYKNIGPAWYGSVDGRYAQLVQGSAVIIDSGDDAMAPDNAVPVKPADAPQWVRDRLDPAYIDS